MTADSTPCGALSPATERQWPLPSRPPTMRMDWHDLLFVHWPVPVGALRPHVPAGLEIDTFDGEAWLGVVPFRMTGVTPTFCPRLPWLSAFCELNVRTYVIRDGKPGVWFHSLDAARAVAVWVARRTFHLPYFHAQMRCEAGDEGIIYHSRRTHRGAVPAAFAASYRPTGEIARTAPAALEHWLTARYCMYAADRKGRIYRGEIDHSPWPLQPAEAEIQENTMTQPLGIKLPQIEPLLHFAARVDAVAWTLRPVGDA